MEELSYLIKKVLIMKMKIESWKNIYMAMNLKLAFNFIVAIYPVLSIYATPGFSLLGLHELVSIIFTVFFFMKKKCNCIIQRSELIYILFSLYSIVFSVIMTFFIKDATGFDMLFRLLRNLLQVVLIAWVGKELFDFGIFFQFYKKIGILSSAFLIIQYIAFMKFGKVIYWLIPGMDLNYTIINEAAYYAHYIGKYYHPGSGVRVTGGFTEPTGFAAFVLPLLALLLIELHQEMNIGKQKKTSIIGAVILVTVSLLISTSATGIICTFAIYIIFIMKFFYRKNKKMIVLLPLFFIFILIVVVIQILTNPELQSLASRLSEINLDKGATSGNQRIIRGFAVWNALPFMMKIFGTGFGNISSCLTSYEISTPYDPEYGSAYMNAVAEIMVSTGLVGMLLFIGMVWKWCFGKWKVLLEYIAVFALLMLSLNMLPSSEFVIMVLVIANYKKEFSIYKSNSRKFN